MAESYVTWFAKSYNRSMKQIVWIKQIVSDLTLYNTVKLFTNSCWSDLSITQQLRIQDEFRGKGITTGITHLPLLDEEYYTLSYPIT